jgi:hypothetical protein
MLAVLVALGTYAATRLRDSAIRRADLVRQFTADFYANDDVVKLFVEMDYDRFTFVEDQKTWLGHKPEITLVRMLDLFNSVGHNWHRRVITLADVQGTTLGYAMLRASASPQVATYLSFVEGWDTEHRGTGVPFEFFRLMANELASVSRQRKVGEGGPNEPPATSLRARDRFKFRLFSTLRRFKWGGRSTFLSASAPV